jgi:hypothetical protein
MSLFGFGNISFNKANSPVNGPLQALEGSQFFTRSLRYPEDVGGYDKGHYMVFYIREQKNSSFAKNDGISDSVINGLTAGKTFENVPLVSNIGTNLGSDLLNKLNSSLNSLNGATGGALSGVTGTVSKTLGSVQSGINNLFGQAASIVSGDAAQTQKILSDNIASITNNSFIKTTQLTADAIALYMPDTLMYTQQQSYDTAAMGGEAVGKVLAAGASSLEELKRGENLKAAGSIAKSLVITGASEAANLLGENTGAVVKRMAGIAENPLLEMIYKSPNFRTFQFDFTFYPRSEKEAVEVQKIIERFRFHQAPEFVESAQGFLKPPSEFDIRFYYGGTQNPNIPKIATCVLTSIDINYAPNGFSAYEIPGESQPSLGRTGMPVAIQMNLQFTETTYLTKKDFTDFDKASMKDAGLPGTAAPLDSSGESPQISNIQGA